MSTAAYDFDVLLVGGGLQNGLLALALLHHRPHTRLAIVEAGHRLGGNHRWSFHAEDVPPGADAWVRPLVELRYPAYDVAFPGLRRTLASPYATFDGARLDRCVRAALSEAPSARIYLGARATAVRADGVSIEEGPTLRGRLVVDARGPGRLSTVGPVAYQKFLGLEVELDGAPPERPVLMDADVDQADGFRFVYVLPLGARRALIEDTYFSDTPDLDVATIEDRIHGYAKANGAAIRAVIRSEQGILPLPRRMPPPAPSLRPLAAGYGGGLFHPTTGYSFPVAARLADSIARADPTHLEREGSLDAFMKAHRRQARFGVTLNRLLFGAFAPADRRNVLERFYRLPEPTIRRFYALDTTFADRSRILCGRPPRGFSLRLALAGAPA